MTSVPLPPSMESLPPRPCISSSPSLPSRSSDLSVPQSRPPLLGTPGTSLVVMRPHFFLMVRVPSTASEHWASSDAVASVWPCSSLRACECTPAQPPTRRRTAHPNRKVPTTAMKRLWRITAHPLALACVLPYKHLGECHTTKPSAPLSRELLLP